MELYKNKNTGQIFILLENTTNTKAMFITPLHEVKELDLELFEFFEEEEGNTLVTQELIDKEDVALYNKYFRGVSNQKVSDVIEIYEQLSHNSQLQFAKDQRIPILKDMWAAFDILSTLERALFWVELMSDEELESLLEKLQRKIDHGQ